MKDWKDIPIDGSLYENVDETVLSRANAALENAYINEAGGHTRFPGLVDFADLDDDGRVYLFDWKGDLIAVTSRGNCYRIDASGRAENVTKVPVAGGQRVSFSRTEDSLIMAAGGQIIEFNGYETKVLSEDAPLSTHVGTIDGFLLAIEAFSQRFQHAGAGAIREWGPLDTFAADSQPDNLTAMIITPFREVILCGERSIEQFERVGTGEIPFFRRWALGEGVEEADTLCYEDNAVWCVNSNREFVRISGQTAIPESGPIQVSLEEIDDLEGAWTAPMSLFGQKFILLQAPYATTPYGGQGLTLAFDYKNRRWLSLYGWDVEKAAPARWPGWSHHTLRGRHFVGGEGKIYELRRDGFSNAGQVQRMLVRTGHYDKGPVRIDDTRMRIKRGVGSNTEEAFINLRCRLDNGLTSRWVQRSLGRAGDRTMEVEFGGFGCCDSTYQFEWFVTDDTQVEVIKFQGRFTKLG